MRRKFKTTIETSLGDVVVEEMGNGYDLRNGEAMDIPFRCSLIHKTKTGKAGRRTPLCKIPVSLAMTKKYGDESLGFFDSISDELAETVYQLHFNDQVERDPLPYGAIVLCNGFADPKTLVDQVEDAMYYPVKDGSLLFQPEILLAIARGLIEFGRKCATPAVAAKHKVYFAFLGLAEKWEDEKKMPEGLLEADLAAKEGFQKAGFAVFRTYCDFCMGERLYLAVHCDAADHPSEKEKKPIKEWQKNVKEFPDRKPGWEKDRID